MFDVFFVVVVYYNQKLHPTAVSTVYAQLLTFEGIVNSENLFHLQSAKSMHGVVGLCRANQPPSAGGSATPAAAPEMSVQPTAFRSDGGDTTK